MTMMRAAVAAEINALGENQVEVIISTSTLARDGHILEPSGCDLSNYQANPIVLWQHNPDVPVGRASDLTVASDKIRALITFAPSGISPKADEVRGLVKNGIVSGVSVGFDVIDSEPLDEKQPRGGQRFTKWELLECSFCSVPADPGASVTARAQPQEKKPMTTTQTRAGKKLSAATKKQLDDAQDHLKRAMDRHKALGDQMDDIREAREDGDEDMRAEVSDLHEDAADKSPISIIIESLRAFTFSLVTSMPTMDETFAIPREKFCGKRYWQLEYSRYALLASSSAFNLV